MAAAPPPAAGGGALAPGLSRKLRKVLETRTDAPEVLASLEALSEFYHENTPAARRALRATVEARGLAVNEEFIASAAGAQAALAEVEAQVAGLGASCDRMGATLDACSAQTGGLISETERLNLELDSSAKRLELVHDFLERYQLTPSEVAALAEGAIGDEFFAALERVRQIHENCKALLRTHHQRAGLELMDAMAAHQEGAYERLCKWVQHECRELGDGDAPEVPEELKRAASVLRQRAVLFRYCAEEVANARHSSLFRRFLAALTRGGPGGMPRPIEVHAHDPLRYVGDMCGWLHQALAEEYELTTALFGDLKHQSTDARAAAASNGHGAGGGGDDEEEAVSTSEVLDRVFEGVCRPFKARVEQVLTTAPDVTLAFKLANLLDFYTHTISDVLSPTAALARAFRQCHAAAQQAFLQLLNSRGAKLLRNPPAVPCDLGVPAEVGQSIDQLSSLLNTHADAMTTASPTDAGAGSDLEQLLSAVLDPVLEAITAAASSYSDAEAEAAVAAAAAAVPPGEPQPPPPPSGLDSPKARAFAMNNVDALAVALLAAPPSATAAVEPRLKALAQAREEHLAAAVDAEMAVVLRRISMSAPLAAAQEMISEGSAALGSKGPACALDAIAAGLPKLYDIFATGGGGGGGDGEEGFPDFAYIRAPDARKEARSKMAIALADAYDALYSAVMASYGRDGQAILQHTPDAARVMLGV